MKIAIVEGSVVTSVLEAAGVYTVDVNGKAARAPATYTVEDASGAAAEEVEYEAVIMAPEGGRLMLSEEASVGWLYENGALVPPPAIPPTKAELLAYAAQKRWQVEIGGLVINGETIDTSRGSQAMITGAFSYSKEHPEEQIHFKALSGWVTLNAPTVAAIATAVGAHVQSCFALEATIAVAIEAGTLTTTAAIDAANWPSAA